MRHSVLLLICAVLFWPGLARAQGGCPAPAAMGDGWAVGSPADHGLDGGLICAIGTRFDAWAQANVHAVLIARHGTLVYERYFTGKDENWDQLNERVVFDASAQHDLRSVSKSVLALLVGIALEQGRIRDIDQPVLSFFPEYAGLATPEKDRMTLRHLLTMSAGLAWNEDLPYSDPRNSEIRMMRAPDPYRFVLEQPVAEPPGERWSYSGGATMLLAAVLQKTASLPLDQLLKRDLLLPLGIGEVTWHRYPNGELAAASGLRMRPRDLMKIGQLVLAKGMWQGRQVVPAAWIAEATSPQVAGEGLFFYGYQWWLGRSLLDRRELSWIAGVGWGGQRLFVVPALDLVILVHAGLYSGPIFQAILGMAVLNRHVLPAVVR